MPSLKTPPQDPSGSVGPGARIKHLRQQLGLSQKELSASLGLSQSTLSQIENDRYYPNYNSLLYLVTELGVDSNWLLLGRGRPYEPSRSEPTLPRQGFPAITEKARAGYSGTDRDEHWVSQLPRYLVPGFRPDADIVIFQVLGDSMLPTLEDQDFVLAERIPQTPESFVGQTLVVVVQDEIYVKRLANFDIALRRLTLNSDNPKYASIEVQQQEALESWHVVGRITRHLAPTFLDQGYRIQQLEGGMQELQDQVARLFDEFATKPPQ